jgi:hypothetical protein
VGPILRQPSEAVADVYPLHARFIIVTARGCSSARDPPAGNAGRQPSDGRPVAAESTCSDGSSSSVT